jgi:hypothetical protein
VPPLIQDGLHSSHLGFGFHQLSDKRLGRLLRFFLWLIGGEWRKIPFDDQCRRSFKMAAILDLVPINYLTNAWVNWSDFFVAYWG